MKRRKQCNKVQKLTQRTENRSRAIRSRSCGETRRHSPASKDMIRKLKSGEYRLYSRKKDAKTGRRKNLGTFKSREAAEKHERAVQYFKRAG